MAFILQSAPYVHAPTSVAQVMRYVLYALLPAISVYVWFFGWGVVVNILIASLTALWVESLMLWLRACPLRPFLQDNSALVMAWLLAFALPPFTVWWMTVLGVAFGLIFAKHVYGGLGNNPFNPAMVGYALLLISFPADMSRWPSVYALTEHYPTLADSFSIIFYGQSISGFTVDAITGATPLDSMRIGLGQLHPVSEVKNNPLFGLFGAKGWEWVSFSVLLGGCWLMYKKIIGWQISLGVLGGLFTLASVFFFISPEHYPSPLFHLFSGASMLCAFFIATDPVSAATSNQGRFIYGVGIGCLIYIIRTWGGYPDGVAFAVLLMNMTVPALDYLTRPTVFGEK
ncbi:electron transport complex subunit RsxD [Beggiatoa leptomitoformis]|uniref:Ion-translocating oxidoreductase complex subunit D n=1 Tax=Beggiatoa leptomitoformis TaxID=288004 RepID=A0A2N9YCG3_9GAMM|nr:electron transport complex subunit RsxD [Beggiatoa leptomitoformis]ALG66541.1 electron transport complex subunit RsxD [Beggiatoa leptomitoformis]AUI68161.1 electron transport complex subunit RsxD [Beggiatoa leptomitoformis]